jgi:hypothetical protein
MTTATEKLTIGMQRLAGAGDDDLMLGQSLLTIHGALEDHFDNWLRTRSAMPVEERETIGSQGWPSRIKQMQTYGTLSEQHAATITRFNRLRTRVAHGDHFTLARHELEGYTALVQALILDTPLPRVPLSGGESHRYAAPRSLDQIWLEYGALSRWIYSHLLLVSLWMALGYIVSLVVGFLFGPTAGAVCLFASAAIGMRQAQGRVIPPEILDRRWQSSTIFSGVLAGLIAGLAIGDQPHIAIAAGVISGALNGLVQWSAIAPLSLSKLWLPMPVLVWCGLTFLMPQTYQHYGVLGLLVVAVLIAVITGAVLVEIFKTGMSLEPTSGEGQSIEPSS